MRNGKISIINRLNFSSVDFFDITAFQNPISSQGRQALNWVKRHAWIAPRTARVINPHRFVDLDLAGHRFGRRETDLAEWHAKIGMNFAGDVNLFRIRQRIGGRRAVGAIVLRHDGACPSRRITARVIRLHPCNPWLKKIKPCWKSTADLPVSALPVSGLRVRPFTNSMSYYLVI